VIAAISSGSLKLCICRPCFHVLKYLDSLPQECPSFGSQLVTHVRRLYSAVQLCNLQNWALALRPPVVAVICEALLRPNGQDAAVQQEHAAVVAH
jgi:hypothetical protein